MAEIGSDSSPATPARTHRGAPWLREAEEKREKPHSWDCGTDSTWWGPLPPRLQLPEGQLAGENKSMQLPEFPGPRHLSPMGPGTWQVS